MAIEAHIGLVGGGKTYTAVVRMAMKIASGGRVATNITLNLPKFAKMVKIFHGWDIQEGQIQLLKTDDEIMKFWRHVPRGDIQNPVFIVIDEASEWLDSGNQRTNEQKEFYSFLRQSRKMGHDVMFITQDLKFLDTRIRALILYTWTFRDMSKFTLPGFGFRLPFLNTIRVMQWVGTSKVLCKAYQMWKEKLVYESYNTTEMFRDFGALEKGVSKFLPKEKGQMSERNQSLMVIGELIAALYLVLT